MQENHAINVNIDMRNMENFNKTVLIYFFFFKNKKQLDSKKKRLQIATKSPLVLPFPLCNISRPYRVLQHEQIPRAVSLLPLGSPLYPQICPFSPKPRPKLFLQGESYVSQATLAGKQRAHPFWGWLRGSQDPASPAL